LSVTFIHVANLVFFILLGVPPKSFAKTHSPENLFEVGIRAVASRKKPSCKPFSFFFRESSNNALLPHAKHSVIYTLFCKFEITFNSTKKSHNMLNKIEHLGIAIKNLENSDHLFAKLIGTEPYKQESVEREGVKTSFFMVGDSKIELLEATNEESPIAKFIEKKGEGIHHIAFAVDDIFAEITRLKAAGFVFISEVPKDGADNKLVVFLHPKSTNGVLVELCQEKL